MVEAFLCDGVRTPIGRYGGALSSVRADDLAAIPLSALKERNAGVDWDAVDDVIIGCANQAGEDNRKRGAHGVIACRAWRKRAGCDRKQALRLWNGCGRHRGTRDQSR